MRNEDLIVLIYIAYANEENIKLNNELFILTN